MNNILLVDDEKNVLNGLKRQFHKQFHLDTALSGQEALGMLRTLGPYAVVVSDCRMPNMDGIQFLSLVRKFAPNTVRIMLTGNNDLETAIEAVNQGEIFRFLTKPCLPSTFKAAIEDALQHYQLSCSKKTGSTKG